jgi:hypothetical protein
MEQQDLNMDNSTGDIRVVNTAGTAIIFDSFSQEEVVAQRNPVINSISKINDPSRHFLVNFNVSVAGSAAAVLSPSTVASYCTSDRRAVLPVDLPVDPVVVDAGRKRPRDMPVPAMVHIGFDAEVERRRRHCAMIYGDMMDLRPHSIYQPRPMEAKKSVPLVSRGESWSPESQSSSPVNEQPRSFASALGHQDKLQRPPQPMQRPPQPMQRHFQPMQRPLPLCNPFSDVRAQFGSPVSSANVTPRTSYETVALCTVLKRDMLNLPSLNTRSSNEEIAITNLNYLSAAASAMRD